MRLIQNGNMTKKHSELFREFESIYNQKFSFRPNPKDIAKNLNNISKLLFTFSFSNLSEFLYGSDYLPSYNEEIIKSILVNLRLKIV